MIPVDWQQLLEEFRGRIAAARAMGGEQKLARQHRDGRNDARQRVTKLCDPDSFRELGTLVGGLSWDALPPVAADAIVTGTARINGRPVAVASEDFSSQGGSIGLGAHAKRTRLASLALQERIPLVLMLEGAGERMTNAMQRYPHAPNDLQILSQLAGRVPVLSLIMGASAGHGALSGMFADLIVMVPGSALFSAGPPLVLQSLGEEIDKETLGGVDVHTRISGVAHNRTADEDEAFALARALLDLYPLNAWERPQHRSGDDDQPRLLPEIYTSLPANQSTPYDIRDIIRMLADGGQLLEIQPEYAPNIVLALARLGGHPIAVVANQPAVKGGAIDRAAADKATRFINSVGNFHFPVLFLTDNPGVLPGSVSEREAVLLAAANMYRAQAQLRSPKLHITLRKAFGFGSSLMAMNPFDRQTISYALPGITLGGIPAAGGAEAAQLDDETRAQLVLLQERASWSASDTMAYDEIIDPQELRNALLTGLEISLGRYSEAVQPRN